MVTYVLDHELVDEIWQIAMSRLSKGEVGLKLPEGVVHLLRKEGLHVIAQRYSTFIGAAAIVVLDPYGVVRITRSSQEPSPAQSGSGSSGNGSPGPSTVPKSKTSGLGKNKVARPPNAFILYRQHHHELLKNANPEMHNNEISVILGSQWKTETAEIKARYQELAQFIKEQHRIQHPDYQYQPRKASERKRRKSRRKVAALNSEVVGDGLVLGLVQPGTIQAGAIEAEPAEEVDTVDHEESLLINDDMEEIDNETVNTKWHHRGGAMYTLQAPIALTTRGLQSVLSEFNKHHAIEADVSRDFQYPVAPIEIRRTEEAEFKEHSIFNMIDWAAVEKDAMQIEMELAAEYELKKSQHRLPDPLM